MTGKPQRPEDHPTHPRYVPGDDDDEGQADDEDQADDDEPARMRRSKK